MCEITPFVSALLFSALSHLCASVGSKLANQARYSCLVLSCLVRCECQFLFTLSNMSWHYIQESFVVVTWPDTITHNGYLCLNIGLKGLNLRLRLEVDFWDCCGDMVESSNIKTGLKYSILQERHLLIRQPDFQSCTRCMSSLRATHRQGLGSSVVASSQAPSFTSPYTQWHVHTSGPFNFSC